MICEKLMNYQTSLFQVEVPENDKKETRFNIAEVGSAGESGPSSPTSPSSPRYVVHILYTMVCAKFKLPLI